MAERLTKKIGNDLYIGKHCDDCPESIEYCGECSYAQSIKNQLGKLEDILEKYGIENVEELENIFKTHHTFDTETSWVPKRTKNYELMIQIMLEDEKGRDYEVLLEKILSHTKKQLDTWKRACKEACDVLRDINYKIYNEDRIDFENSFYQQAKKEKESENNDKNN